MAEDDARHRLDLDVADRGALDLGAVADLRLRELDVLQRLARKLVEAVLLLPVAQPIIVAVPPVEAHRRSEEHTSELQSLMRISYAVFCLKQKKTTYKTKS